MRMTNHLLLLCCLLPGLLFTVRGLTTLTSTIITWEYVPLESSYSTFPVGTEVCNTGAESTTGVTAKLAITSGASNFQILPGSIDTVSDPETLTAGECREYYFLVSRLASTNGASSTISINVTSDNSNLSTSPAGVNLVTNAASTPFAVTTTGSYTPPSSNTNMYVGSTYNFDLGWQIGSATTDQVVLMMTYIPFPNSNIRTTSVVTSGTWTEWFDGCAQGYNAVTHTCSGKTFTSNNPLKPSGSPGNNFLSPSTTGTTVYSVSAESPLSQTSIQPFMYYAARRSNNQNGLFLKYVNTATTFNVKISEPLNLTTSTSSMTWSTAAQAWTLVYVVTAQNKGDQPLTSLILDDSLDTTFSNFSTSTYEVESIVRLSGTINVNPLYDGSTQTNLLAGSQSLIVGAEVKIQLTIRVTNFPSSSRDDGTYTNSVVSSWTGSNLVTYSNTASSTAELISQPSYRYSFDKLVMLGANQNCNSATTNVLNVQSQTFPIDVTYCYIITNSGPVVLTNVYVQDDINGTPVDPRDDVNVTFSNVAPGNTATVALNDNIPTKKTVVSEGTVHVTPISGDFSVDTITQYTALLADAAVLQAISSNWDGVNSELTISVNLSISVFGALSTMTLNYPLAPFIAAVSSLWSVQNIISLGDFTADGNFNGNGNQNLLSLTNVPANSNGFVSFDIVFTALGQGDYGKYASYALINYTNGVGTYNVASNTEILAVIKPPTYNFQYVPTVMLTGGTCGVDSGSSLSVVTGTSVTFCYQLINSESSGLLASQITIYDNMATISGADDVQITTTDVAGASVAYFTRTAIALGSFGTQAFTFTSNVTLSPSQAYEGLLKEGQVSLTVFNESQVIFSIDLLTWEIVGLDSNKPETEGPNIFPVAIRVTNTGSDTAIMTTATLSFLGTRNPYIQIYGKDTVINYPDLAPGESTNFWFAIAIDPRVAASFFTSQEYTISVQSQGSAVFEAPKIGTNQNRYFYIEKLISQSRNSVQLLELDSVVYLGSIEQAYTEFSTATNGYEQIESAVVFPNDLVRVLNVTLTFTAPFPGYTINQEYDDACTWDPVARDCLSTGKTGGDGTATYYMSIVGVGTVSSVSTLIYDFSGSSYHYNADFGGIFRSINILNPVGGFTKTLSSFSYNNVLETYTGTYSISLTNVGDQAINEVQIQDNLTDALGVIDATFVVDSVTVSAGFTVNTNYNGVGDIDTLTGSDTLAPNATVTVLITFTLSNIAENIQLNYTNIAVGCFTGNNLERYCSESNATFSFETPSDYPWSFVKTVKLANETCGVDDVDLLDIPAGNNVTYCYRVTNNGPETLLNTEIVDDNGTPFDTSDDFTVFIPSVLAGGFAYGESNSLLLDLPQTRLNIAVATITTTDPYFGVVKEDNATVTVYNPFEGQNCTCEPVWNGTCLVPVDGQPNICTTRECNPGYACDNLGSFICTLELVPVLTPTCAEVLGEVCCETQVKLIPIVITPTPVP